MSSTSDILISAQDAERLALMLGEWPRRHRGEEEAAQALADTLEGARVVASDQVPEGIVTMDSTVTYVAVPDNRRSTVQIVYPAQANAGAGRVSVLSPIARALLGRQVQSVIDIVLPTGRPFALRIVDVLRRSVKDEEVLALP
ncbi:MAG: GreA/GreB family elongation factor [Burkholderiales bacterium]|nr:GreA/GreB family elongation factor [Burkholderiales bacterium]